MPAIRFLLSYSFKKKFLKKGKIQIMISKMLILFEVLKDKNTVLEAMIFNKIL